MWKSHEVNVIEWYYAVNGGLHYREASLYVHGKSIKYYSHVELTDFFLPCSCVFLYLDQSLRFSLFE